MSVAHYKKTIKNLVFEYNRDFPAPYYFGRFIKRKAVVKVCDLGAGPVCTVGNLWGKTKIEIYASDVLAKDYQKIIDDLNVNLKTPIEYQNMEKLTYPDNFFDIVHCVNALDHVKDLRSALSEMKRICKIGGYVYLRHGHNQKNANRDENHFWNCTTAGFKNEKETVTLDEFHTSDDGYYVVSIMKKV